MTGSGRQPTVYLSGVNDEPSATWNLEDSLATFDDLGWRLVALRAVDGTVVDDMSDAVYAAVLNRLRERGFGVTSYLSMKLGRSLLDVDDHADERHRLLHAISRARLAGTKLIRVMGYKRGNCRGGERLSRTLARFGELVSIASDADVVLGIEMLWPAWQSVSGSPLDLWRLLSEIDSPYLRLILDPGNTASFGQDIAGSIDLLAPLVADVHVKDCAAFGKRDFCLAGDGVCDWPHLLRRLAAAGYSGPITIEPHLLHDQQFHVSGPQNFIAAGRRIEQLLLEAGFSLATLPTPARE